MLEIKNFYGTNLNRSNLTHMTQRNLKFYGVLTRQDGGMEFVYLKNIQNQLIDGKTVVYLSCLANG
jgi:hypothetical protein